MPLPTALKDSVVKVAPRKPAKPRRGQVPDLASFALGGGAAAPAVAASAPPTSWGLNIKVEQQSTPNWCWAATGQALARFHRAQGTAAWTQCEVASAVRGVACCPGGTPAGTCDSIEEFDDVLVGLGLRYGGANLRRPLTFDEIVALITNSIPIVAQFGWLDAAGTLTGAYHLVVVYGYYETPDDKWVYVYDPQDTTAGGHVRSREVTLDAMLTQYAGVGSSGGLTGKWIWSFFPN